MGYFTTLFVERVPSRYTNSVSFRCGMDQASILTSRIEDCIRMNEVEESLTENPFFRVFSENPLKLGFYLESITTGNFFHFVYMFSLFSST